MHARHVLSAVVSAPANDLRTLLRNPAAFAGGIGGLVLAVLVAYAVTAVVAGAAGSTDADAAAVDPFELEFAPGTLARLGEPPLRPLPPKVVIQDQRAPDPPAPAASVSVDETATATPRPPRPSKSTAATRPDDRDARLPTGPTPTRRNTPYDDPATVDRALGDPFADPEGWDDLTRAGDPWATEVMKRLTNMPVGTYAGGGLDGDFRLRLTICKDGRIKRVHDAGGTLSEAGRDAVRLALSIVRLPEPTAEIARAMPSECVALKYTFVWTDDGVQ